MKKAILMAVLILVVISLSGCMQKGTLVMQITDAPPELNIEKVVVTISNIEVHKPRQGENASNQTGWFTVVEEAQIFDLIAIKDVKEFLGSASLDAGKYTQIRLNVDNAIATIDGSEYELEVPSEKIKLVKQFDIVAGQITTLTLDFDAQESIHARGKDEYVMSPTIKVLAEGEEAEEEEEAGMTQEEAMQIAQDSECTEEGGVLTENVFYNQDTGTWWIDLEPFDEKPLCNPACVVNVKTKKAEINWRCTGALPPEE